MSYCEECGSYVEPEPSDCRGPDGELPDHVYYAVSLFDDAGQLWGDGVEDILDMAMEPDSVSWGRLPCRAQYVAFAERLAISSVLSARVATVVVEAYTMAPDNSGGVHTGKRERIAEFRVPDACREEP